MCRAPFYLVFEVRPYPDCRVINDEPRQFVRITTETPIPCFERGVNIVAFYGWDPAKVFQRLPANRLDMTNTGTTGLKPIHWVSMKPHHRQDRFSRPSQ